MARQQATAQDEVKAAAGAPGEVRYKRIHIIVNPASGQDRPVLSILNAAFQNTAIDWDILVTKAPGDARRYAEAAVRAGVDAVGVYGGDGSVMEVASALVNQPVPLAIFPGGTANVMSVELGIPSDLTEACALVSRQNSHVRAIDVGQAGDHIFLTRVGMGIEANVIGQTDREQKDRMGWMAYVLNTLRELAEPKMSAYRLKIDGRPVETEGLLCIVANSGILSPNTGMPGRATITFAPNISISDGLLDVVVIRRGNLGALLEVAASMMAGNEDAEPLLHWQGREIEVAADPSQIIQCDGELLGETPIATRILPGALRVIVPASAEPPTAAEAPPDARDRPDMPRDEPGAAGSTHDTRAPH